VKRLIANLAFRCFEGIPQARVAALGFAALGVDKPVLHAHTKCPYSFGSATDVVSLASGGLS